MKSGIRRDRFLTHRCGRPLVGDDDAACCSLFAWGTRSHNFNAMHIRAEGNPPTGRSSCYIQSFIDFCNARYVMDVRGVSCYGKHMCVLLLVSPPLHVRELLHPPPATLPCWNSMPRGFPPPLYVYLSLRSGNVAALLHLRRPLSVPSLASSTINVEPVSDFRVSDLLFITGIACGPGRSQPGRMCASAYAAIGMVLCTTQPSHPQSSPQGQNTSEPLHALGS